jgi:hypothetical protein
VIGPPSRTNTHIEATPTHPEDHYNGVYWEYDNAMKMLEHLVPQ